MNLAAIDMEDVARLKRSWRLADYVQCHRSGYPVGVLVAVMDMRPKAGAGLWLGQGRQRDRRAAERDLRRLLLCVEGLHRASRQRTEEHGDRQLEQALHGFARILVIAGVGQRP